MFVIQFGYTLKSAKNHSSLDMKERRMEKKTRSKEPQGGN